MINDQDKYTQRPGITSNIKGPNPRHRGTNLPLYPPSDDVNSRIDLKGELEDPYNNQDFASETLWFGTKVASSPTRTRAEALALADALVEAGIADLQQLVALSKGEEVEHDFGGEMNKYQPGEGFKNFLDLMDWVSGGRYIYWHKKPLHPLFVLRMSLAAIMRGLENSWIRKAVEIPEKKG